MLSLVSSKILSSYAKYIYSINNITKKTKATSKIKYKFTKYTGIKKFKLSFAKLIFLINSFIIPFPPLIPSTPSPLTPSAIFLIFPFLVISAAGSSAIAFFIILSAIFLLIFFFFLLLIQSLFYAYCG